MVTSHLQLKGGYALCEQLESCELKFHFPDMAPSEMLKLPWEPLFELLNTIDPPTVVESDGVQFWYKGDSIHRDYDLPAVIAPGRVLAWYAEGDLHRVGKPAMLKPHRAKGIMLQEWYEKGELLRRTHSAL